MATEVTTSGTETCDSSKREDGIFICLIGNIFLTVSVRLFCFKLFIPDVSEGEEGEIIDADDSDFIPLCEGIPLDTLVGYISHFKTVLYG